MKITRLRTIGLLAGLVSSDTALLTTLARAQASALGLAVGQTASFRIVSSKADGSRSENTIRFARINPTIFNVSVDGKPFVPVEIEPGGSLAAPDSLNQVLAPFKQVAVLMRGAPQPLAPNSSWAASMPVPLGSDQTDNVPLTVSVASLSPSGVNVRAVGQNATSTRPRVRRVEEDVMVTYTLTFDAARNLSNAEGDIGVDAQRRFVSKNFGTVWTLTRTGP
jgi:hypothetical protein